MKAFSIVHLGPTLVKRVLIAAFALGLAVTGAWGAQGMGGASPDNNSAEVTYRYLVGAGLTQLGSVCDVGIPCPTAAMASNGDTVTIIGEGKLSIQRKQGKPESVSGGGSFLHTNAAGGVVAVGTWTAKRLLSFESFGPGVGTPPTWEGGLARIQVQLAPDSGAGKAEAILEVGCLLPGIAPHPGVPEGVKLNVLGLLNFDLAIEPRATLFINLGDEEADD